MAEVRVAMLAEDLVTITVLVLADADILRYGGISKGGPTSTRVKLSIRTKEHIPAVFAAVHALLVVVYVLAAKGCLGAAFKHHVFFFSSELVRIFHSVILPFASPYAGAYANLMKRWSVGAILILSFCGIAVSAYLAQSEATGNALICDIQSLSGCNAVVTSEYSRIFGISLADFGLLFYAILFVAAAFELVLFNWVLRRLLQLFALVGIIASLYSVYTQVFIINALCIYCLTSALLTFLILIGASLIEPLRQRLAPVRV